MTKQLDQSNYNIINCCVLKKTTHRFRYDDLFQNILQYLHLDVSIPGQSMDPCRPPESSSYVTEGSSCWSPSKHAYAKMISITILYRSENTQTLNC